MVIVPRMAAALSASFLLSMGHDALAHHPGGPGNFGAAGPIITLPASTLAEGATVAGVIIDYTSLDPLSDETLIEATARAHQDSANHLHVHSLESIASPSLNLAHGLTDNLTVGMRLPFVMRQNIRVGHAHEEEEGGGEPEIGVQALGDASGIGDLSALAQWRFVNNRASGFEAAALFGFTAPTGRTNTVAANGETFDAEFQPGSGAWSGLFGLALAQRLGAFSLNASALYTAVTEGIQATDLGDRVNYGLAVSYRAIGGEAHEHGGRKDPGHQHASQGPTLDLVLELNGEWQAKQTTLGETDPNSGGHVLYLSPGARLSLDKWSGFVSVGVPIVNDLNGVQAEPACRILSGASLAF